MTLLECVMSVVHVNISIHARQRPLSLSHLRQIWNSDNNDQ